MISQITLNTSLCIYFIWFAPQIFLNFKRKNTQGFSIGMHNILCIAYLSDLMYGIGRDMQWQYRMVTIVGLLSLAIQHYQFFRYGWHDIKQRTIHTVLTMLYLCVLGYIALSIYANQHTQAYDDLAGMLANLCWLSYMLPQIIKNYRNQSTVGLSISFVFLAIFINCCDSISAWSLDWDYPSKVGPIMALMGNTILLLQVFYYARKDKSIGQLVTHS